MNLLFISPRECWPPTSGARLRDFYLARHLARRSTLTYVALHQSGDPYPDDVPSSAGFSRYIVLTRGRGYTPSKLLRGMLGPLPVTILNYYSPHIAAKLAGILADGRFDAVQLESTHLFGYLPVIQADSHRPIVLADWHNIESELMRRYGANAPDLPHRLVARRTAHLIERAENRLLAACDVHTVASARERQKLAERVPAANLHVIPNGVDIEYFADSAIAAARQHDSPAHPEILYVGSMDYHANIDAMLWFAREIWPELERSVPALSLTIAGRRPTPEIQALASPRIAVTGTVDDVRPFYARAAAVIVPLRVGSGTRLKILEAMAAGVPVISTTRGAEGLDVEHGRHILLADTPQEFAAAVRNLLASPETAARLAADARNLVRQVYDWAILGERLYEILQTASLRK